MSDDNHEGGGLEEKLHAKPTMGGRFGAGAVIGTALDFFFPGVGLGSRLLYGAAVAGALPLIEKARYSKATVGELYATAPYAGIGSVIGQSVGVGSYLRNLWHYLF